MFTTVFATLAMLLTLALPIFPDGLTIPIAGFLLLIGLAGFGGFLRSEPARAELALLVPWVLALTLGVMVGTLRGNPLSQGVEDALPYVLFALGLCAGRGVSRPVWLLVAILAVCVIDGVMSIAYMQSYDLSRYRSTYNYFKVIAGHLLVGVYAAVLLRHLLAGRVTRRVLEVCVVVLVVAIVATVSRGMMLGLVLGALTSLLVRKPAQGVMIGGVMAGLVLLFTASVFEVGQQYLRLGQQATVDGRVREIALCLEAFTEMPVLGAGLGAELVVDGFVHSYVHNMLAYHLWKFGLVGSGLLALPFLGLVRQALRAPLHLRATILGGAVSMFIYVVTAASYKSYFLVPMIGLVVGASYTLALPAGLPAPAKPRSVNVP